MAAITAVTGVALGYNELVAFGLVAVALLAVAVVLSRRDVKIDVAQRLDTFRVARGDDLQVTVSAFNGSSDSVSGSVVETSLDGAFGRHGLEALGPSERASARIALPTSRRGSFTVGPPAVYRSDPLGLTSAVSYADRPDNILVHPRVHPLRDAHGQMRNVDHDSLRRRRGTDPLSGFVSLREYTQGDDPRLIHWPTTARSGMLMVKETVEFRRPEFVLVVDAAVSVADPDTFEEMVDVAATLAVHACEVGLAVVIRSTSREHPGRKEMLADPAEVLDYLTSLGQVDGAEVLSLLGLFTGGISASSVLMITGPNGPSSVLDSGAPVHIVRIGSHDESGRGVIMAAKDAVDFSQRWRGTP